MTRILYIEDNEDNIYMIERRLKKAGYQLQVARDGLAGLDTAHAEQPDLILLDLSLPKLDGCEVARRLKADPATQAIPIVALTAHATTGDWQAALDAGCEEFETKPVHWKRLKALIETLLQSTARDSDLARQ